MEKDTDNIIRLRDEKGTFKKGGCGNPEGKIGVAREAALIEKMTVEQMYREHAKEVFEVLLKIIRAKDTPATPKINAIKEYNQRALGSPTSTTIIKSEDESEAIDFSDLDDETLRIVAAKASRAGRVEK